MKRTRYIKTHIFAAALYACACLMVYGTVAAAQARPVAAQASACVRQQQCSACRAASGAMLSTVVAAVEQHAAQEFPDQPAPLGLYERHALRPVSTDSAASCALLSRRLADA
jgi:hypothetical protein